ncbi:hypothetical protein INP83_11450 [Mucilaginibacter sp. 21P]|uniref:hypothetical protein n=1 Tax=Mucilaginibacter sp. 21P TaxID=2778902 RepID=UPI001C59D955|nr:hypothetical protein [Mucilaginibacter sp. 21P]QXV63724.1 hypothetical protein INP83_11450 [Mucilaginibacter sp. 21P]
MAKKQKTPDGPESSAGDDFHILWSIRKSLELFNFNQDGLKAITIEGAAPEDAKILDPDEDLLLGVDVGEYFGGEKFEDYNKLVFSQLKYSTRHPTMPWTIARICQGKKAGSAGSIIHRLGDVFKSHISAFGEIAVQKKLTLKLVSNRPVAIEVLNIIAAVKVIVTSDGSLPPFAKLKSQIDKTFLSDLEKIKNASGLAAKDVALFISLLDFADCGASSRAILKEDTIWAINKVNSITQIDHYNALHVKISSKMMPENRENNKLTMIDMLKVFNAGTPLQLFPVPPQFEPHKNLVIRKQLGQIKENVLNAGSLPVCLHAGAGMGKSSVVQQLSGQLPEGSEVLLFDCYGGGTYLDPDDARHKPEWALKQLSNQMALLLGSDFFLLPAGQPSEVYFRDFSLRVKEAAAILQQKNSEAILVIVIDAADNSIAAANLKAERSFVLDLLRITFPSNCRLLVTTRTYRLTSLNLPNHVSIELLPFSEEETFERINPIFENLDFDKVRAFHELTFGIPRVQTYALVNKESGIDSIIEPLKPNGKNLDDIINFNIDFVKTKLGNSLLVDTILRYLIALPRPVSMDALVSLTSTTKEVLNDIATDIGQGIIPNNGNFNLTDEDFEDYLERKYPFTNEVIQEVANYFLTNAESDAYASRHLGNMLRRAGRYDILKDIVFNGKYLKVPQDPVVLKEMVIERTMAAMNLSIAENNSVDFLKMQVVAAEAAKTNDLLEQTLISNGDLTALYGDQQTIEKLIQADRLKWYAPVHFRCAAIYARNKETLPEAKEHFKAAQSWMEWRDRQNSRDVQQPSMNSTDFIYAAEAFCRLTNLKSCLDFLGSYNYHRMSTATRGFLQHMLCEAPESEVTSAILQLDWYLPAKINITRTYFRSGRQSPIDGGNVAKEFIAGFAGRKLLGTQGNAAALELGEYLAWQRNSVEEIMGLISAIRISNPSYFPKFYASNYREDKELIKLDRIFKTKALFAALTETALSIKDFYSSKIKAIDPEKYLPDNSIREERQRADILFGPIITLYAARARFLAGKISEDSFLAVFKEYPNIQYRNYERYRYNRELVYFNQHYAAIFSDILFFVNAKSAFCDALLACFSMKENAIGVRLDIATTLSRNSSGHLVALNLLKDAADKIFNSETGAGAKIDDYLRCVRIGGRLDKTVGGAYFKRMIETVGEMDLEGFEQVKFIGELANSISGRYPKLSFDYAHFTHFAHSRLRAWDNFPWRESIGGLAALDHFGVWATLARWDHLNLVKIEDHLLTSIAPSIRRGFLKPGTHAVFLLAAGVYSDEFNRQLEVLIDKENLKESSALSALGRYFYRLIKFESVKYLQRNILENLKRLLLEANCKDDSLYKDIDESVSCLDASDYEETDFREVINLTGKSGISIPDIDWADIPSLHKNIAGWLTKEEGSVLDYLLAMRQACSIGQFLPFLNLVSELENDIIGNYDRERLLKDTLELWKDHPGLPEWKLLNFLPYLQRVFPAYIEHQDLYNIPGLKKIANLFDATDDQLAQAIKVILSKNIERMDAEMIYHLAKFTKLSLTEDQLISIIEWVLNRWIAKMPLDWQTNLWEEKFNVSDDSQNAAAGLIRYILGHPRKELRWRTIHGLRLAGRMGDLSLLQPLLSLQNDKLAIPFQHTPYTFYWMSAKLWLWIFMKKAAEEKLNDIEQFAAVAFQSLQDKSLPHSLIIYHIQQFCLSIQSTYSGTYSAEQLLEIEFALKPKPGQKKIGIKASSLISPNDLKFRFDTTDTIPYWYQPLCQVFDIPYLTIANRANEVITGDWNYNGDVNEDDHVDTNDRAYNSTSNSHGDIPEVEKLRHYFEFHAMFCVATRLVKESSSAGKSAANLKEWLEDWNTTYDQLWLFDLRDVTPIDPILHRSERPDDWEKSINNDHVLSFLQTATGFLTVAAIIKLTYGSYYETVHLNSALVRKMTGQSLLYALHDMPLHRYKLPEEDEDSHEINEDGFVLKGWYYDVGGRNEVHDRLDPLANHIKQHYLKVGDLFMKWGKFELSKDFRWVRDGKLNSIAHFENWDDSTPYPDYHNIETDGQRLSVSPGVILNYLKDHDFSLLVEIKVDRDESRRSYSKNDERLDIEFKNIYLIESDGTVKTVEGDFKLRPENR